MSEHSVTEFIGEDVFGSIQGGRLSGFRVVEVDVARRGINYFMDMELRKGDAGASVVVYVSLDVRDVLREIVGRMDAKVGEMVP